MADDKKPEQDEVEAHGAKQVAGVGLAAAALIGAGAGAVKLATDDDSGQRNVGALLSPEAHTRLKQADTDRDGYVNYRDLAHEGFKLSVAPMKVEGADVTAEALSSAGAKIELAAIGKEGGFALERDTILLKSGVDSKVDELVKGDAQEWTDKHKGIDVDGDGYASFEELEKAGFKVSFDELGEAGSKHSPEELEKAGIKIGLASLGEGGFVTKEDMVILKYGVDQKLDAFIKGEKEG